jgi:non-specific serine/threonine protein kinase
MAWISQQLHDPFPNMARHRVIYVLDPSEGGQIKVSLFKAYLTQDDRYQVKAKIDSSLYYKKQLPKFFSLADQFIFHQINQNGLAQVHQFTVDASRDQAMVVMMLKTQRCFWKACYRPPISFHEVSEKLPPSAITLTQNVQFLLAENAANLTVDKVDQVKNLSQYKNFRAVLHITTIGIDLDWSTAQVQHLDVAQPQFMLGQTAFDLHDLISGAVIISPEQLEQVAAACYQIQKLPSVLAEFEPPISQYFQVNDRYLGDDFTAIAPLLVALQEADWQVVIEPEFRLNRVAAEQWYVDIKKAAKPGSQGTDGGWFDLQIGIEVNQQKFNLLPYLIKAIKTGGFDHVKKELMIQLDNGVNVGVAREQVEQILNTISELYDGKTQKNEKTEASLLLSQHQLLQVAQAKQQLTTALQIDHSPVQWLGIDEIQHKAEAMQNINQLEVLQPPSGLNAELRPYQLEGYSWLMFLAEHQFHGLLADDMGLGKTLQTLAFIQAQKNLPNKVPTSLIVAPTSLLGNWAAEAAKFTPGLKVGVMTGPNRQVMYQKFNDYDLIVSSYGIISRDFADLNQKQIHLLVLDEAQAIKNRKTQVAQIIKRLSAQHRLCLSGTPVENHLGELWSIFDFLMPGFLGREKQFQQRFQWPIEKENDLQALAVLQTRVAPFVLRRTKAKVAKELPDKSEIIKYIDLEESQATVYESIRLTMADEIRQAVKSQQNNQILIGNALLRLRQVCCHPQLVQLKSVNTDAQSAKLNWLLNALPSLVEEGRKVLIFSSFTSMLKIIATELEALNIDFYQLTGSTPPAKRTEFIDGFQDHQKPIFLISLKAGGAGINLTAADTVIHYDPWWNPAAEQQASDRAHRIGQDKQVFVYKLITRGTVEEKIHQLQLKKQQLADGLLSKRADISAILSEHQWQDMLAPIDSLSQGKQPV